MMSLLEGMELDRKEGKRIPLYKQIREYVRESINRCELKPGDRLPTIASLTKHWDVDYSTVHSAFELLANEGLVTLEHRKGILVKKRPQNKDDSHAVIFVRWQADLANIDLFEGISRFCDEVGDTAICLESSRNGDHQPYLPAYEPFNAKGLIIVPLDIPEFRKAIEQVLVAGHHVAFVNHSLAGMDVSSVTPDYFQGGYRATSHLMTQHGTPVHYLGTDQSSNSLLELYGGWAAAMREHNHHDLAHHTIKVEANTKPAEMHVDTRRIFRDAMATLFERCRQRTCAVFAQNYHCVQGIYLAAEDFGLEIGKDVLVVGLSNSPDWANIKPTPSSVWQPYTQIGYDAARLLSGQFERHIKKPCHQVVPMQLRIRESSAGNQSYPPDRQESKNP